MRVAARHHGKATAVDADNRPGHRGQLDDRPKAELASRPIPKAPKRARCWWRVFEVKAAASYAPRADRLSPPSLLAAQSAQTVGAPTGADPRHWQCGPATTAVCAAPQLTSTISWREKASTARGVALAMRAPSPWPSCPRLPSPHVNSWPASVNEAASARQDPPLLRFSRTVTTEAVPVPVEHPAAPHHVRTRDSRDVRRAARDTPDLVPGEADGGRELRSVHGIAQAELAEGIGACAKDTAIVDDDWPPSRDVSTNASPARSARKDVRATAAEVLPRATWTYRA